MRCSKCGTNIRGYSADAVVCVNCATGIDDLFIPDEQPIEERCEKCGKLFSIEYLNCAGLCIDCTNYINNGWRMVE